MIYGIGQPLTRVVLGNASLRQRSCLADAHLSHYEVRKGHQLIPKGNREQGILNIHPNLSWYCYIIATTDTEDFNLLLKQHHIEARRWRDIKPWLNS
ncbi:hypothetical protein [Coleofasciculus sp.]|uniref:hypothetical protein n=1 Tax=Coleofasciculus sp. TaxID=3100458 RepID=UPI003A37409C